MADAMKRDRAGRKVAAFAPPTPGTRCVRCGSVKTTTLSGPRKQGTLVIRKHGCQTCGRQFDSHQPRAEYDAARAKKVGATPEPESVPEAPAAPPKRRGRPPGAKNKGVGKAPKA